MKTTLHKSKHWEPRVPVTMLLSALVLILFMTACTDEREAPVAPEDDSYTETITLLDEVAASGQDMSMSFSLRDPIVSGLLYLTCQLIADDDLNAFETYGVDIDMLTEMNDDIDVAILNMELADSLSALDSLILDSLRLEKQTNLDSIEFRMLTRDTLDTYLDDRFKVSIWLDSDTVEYYPSAVFLDSETISIVNGDTITLSYLDDNTVVWGQSFYLMPESPDIEDDYRGKTLRLDLDGFQVADGGWDIGGPYVHSVKPERGVALPEPFPIPDFGGLTEDWIDRLNQGSQHTLHVRFGAAGTVCKVTASFYVTYSREG